MSLLTLVMVLLHRDWKYINNYTFVFVALFVATGCKQGSQKSIYTADMDDMAASRTLKFTYVTKKLDMSKEVIKVCGLIWMAGPPSAWQELSLQCRNTSCEESDKQLRQCYECISSSGMVCRNDTINSTSCIPTHPSEGGSRVLVLTWYATMQDQRTLSLSSQ